MRAARYSARGEAQPLLPPSQPQTHPQEHAPLLSRLFILWLEPLLHLANTRQLQPEDVWPLPPPLRCETAANLLHRHWIASGSLSSAFLRAFGWRYVPVGLLLAVAYACDLAGPLVLFHIVDLVGHAAALDVPQLVQWLALLFATRVLKALLVAFVYAETQVVALQFASALQSIVFQKALRLSAETRKSTAEVVDVYTADVQRIVTAAYCLHDAWVLPLAVAAALGLLVSVVGVATLAGLAAALTVLALNQTLARAQKRSFTALARTRDARVAVVRDVFATIQTVKLHAWEPQVAARIGDARTRELRALRWHLLLGAGHIVGLWAGPVVVATAMLAVYALVLHEPLTAANVFTALALFRVLQEPLRTLPRIATGLVHARLSVRRVIEFIDLDEVDPYAVAGRDTLDVTAKYEPMGVAVAVEGVTCGWGGTGSSVAPPLFHALSLTIARGDLVVVHGDAGAGKSSLCALLLGEMTTRYGRVYVGGAVAYCSQQPWLQCVSVRDNILFGRAFDSRKYDKVLDACGLTADVAALPMGDRTEVGGSQALLLVSLRARIALARACYSDADVFVLDAPLAAVDAAVAHEVFVKCVVGLLQHKTRMLVTQDPEIIASKFADSAIRVGAGGVLALTRNAERAALVDPPVSPLDAGGDRHFGGAHSGPHHSRHRRRSGNNRGRQLLSTETTATAAETVVMSQLNPRTVDAAIDARSRTANDGQEMEDGNDATHARSDGCHELRRAVTTYFEAVGGLRVVCFVVGVQCGWQLLQILSDLWLAHWASESTTEQQTHERANVLLYTALALSGSLLVLVRTLTVSRAGLRGAQQLFDAMTASLLRAPLTFFDTTPVSHILRRYSDDVTSVDVRLPFAVGTVLAVAFANGCALVTAAVVTRYFGLLVVPVLYVYVRVAALYLRPARELQRLQNASQAPMLTHVAETTDGASVVRAFGREHTHRFIAENLSKIDTSNRHVHAGIYAGQWLRLRVQLLGGVLVVGVASALVALVALHASLTAGLVGLALHYALAVDQGLEALVQAWAWLESALAAPERMQEYIEVPPETGADTCTTVALPTAWPGDGRVTFENVSFCRGTDDGELVLRDVSLELAPGETVGVVVGRADVVGLSILAMVLCRVHELAAGRVLIDGVDTAAVDLPTLRSALVIVPQSPQVANGSSVRDFLDPFDEFADEHLWFVLRKAGLAAAVAAMDGMLYAPLEANEGAFGSAGERQLLCLARALLSDARVLVLDEAADVYSDTDRRRRQVLRGEFAHATVLTVAHAHCLDAVLEADRVLVLDDSGRVADLDAPDALLSRGHGLLYDLAMDGGYLKQLSAVDTIVAAVETTTTTTPVEEEGDEGDANDANRTESSQQQ